MPNRGLSTKPSLLRGGTGKRRWRKWYDFTSFFGMTMYDPTSIPAWSPLPVQWRPGILHRYKSSISSMVSGIAMNQQLHQQMTVEKNTPHMSNHLSKFGESWHMLACLSLVPATPSYSRVTFTAQSARPTVVRKSEEPRDETWSPTWPRPWRRLATEQRIVSYR